MKKRTIFGVVLLLLASTVLPLKAQTIGWVRQFTDKVAGGFGGANDPAGNVYVTGSVRGALPGQSLSQDDDVFVRKYNTDGIEVWTRQFGAIMSDRGTGVAADSLGNVYVAGFIQWGQLAGQLSFGRADAFVRKYDSSGLEMWTRQFGTSNDDWGTGVAVDPAILPTA